MAYRVTIPLLLCLTLASCGSNPKVEWANNRGGMVSYSGSSEAKAMSMADDICAKSYRRAQVTTMNDEEKRITFNCVE